MYVLPLFKLLLTLKKLVKSQEVRVVGSYSRRFDTVEWSQSSSVIQSVILVVWVVLDYWYWCSFSSNIVWRVRDRERYVNEYSKSIVWCSVKVRKVMMMAEQVQVQVVILGSGSESVKRQFQCRAGATKHPILPFQSSANYGRFCAPSNTSVWHNNLKNIHNNVGGAVLSYFALCAATWILLTGTFCYYYAMMSCRSYCYCVSKCAKAQTCLSQGSGVAQEVLSKKRRLNDYLSDNSCKVSWYSLQALNKT